VLKAQRQREILRLVADRGSVQIADVAARLGVDASTIRRDLAQLGRAGLVERARGGALAGEAGAAVDIPYDMKRSVEIAAKRAIGEAAAAVVRDGETILLDSGSTTLQMVPWLRDRSLTVVTNDLQIAMQLARLPRIRLVVTGGVLLETVFTLVGPQTLAALAELHVDRAFLGADAIDREAGITNINLVEVPVKRAMLAAAAAATVLADATKFERRALARVAGLHEIAGIITDDRVPAAVRAHYAGVAITYVPLARVPQGADAATGVAVAQ
jgi:DeoR family transcriptional regulator of aga operon